MSEPLRLNAPMHGYDPISAHVDRLAVAQDQDESVIERCPEVFRQVLKVVARYGDALEHGASEDGLVWAATPYFEYQTPLGNTAIMKIEVDFQKPGTTLDTIQESSEGVLCSLLGRSELDDDTSEDCFVTISTDSIDTCYEDEVLYGRHHDLNFLLGLMSGISGALKVREQKEAQRLQQQVGQVTQTGRQQKVTTASDYWQYAFVTRPA